jgi:hypothetical protein
MENHWCRPQAQSEKWKRRIAPQYQSKLKFRIAVFIALGVLRPFCFRMRVSVCPLAVRSFVKSKHVPSGPCAFVAAT